LRINIMGTDLQQEGITRNQQIEDFREDSKKVADLLTRIVVKANPVKTVRRASEAEQKLVWVVAPDPDDPNQRALLITTRSAAERKGYELPRQFRD
jgi:hypothetical protein